MRELGPRWSHHALCALLLLGSAQTARAATSGDNGTHDPSRMIESDGRFYVYSTGGGSKSSPDGLVWTSGPGIFAGTGIPASTTAVVANNEGVWAPDAIYLNGKYYLYYSIANKTCAIGLVTSPTLNPSSPDYKWTDQGLVVTNAPSGPYCTIDPAPVLDADGNLWLSWGSGYSGPATRTTIYLTRLDTKTGLASTTDKTKPGYPLEPGHIEASYIYYHSSYYYLFWNSGGCCNGASSTYLIHVARSQTITGPYTGTKSFYGSTGSIHGPGQIGIYDQCGASRFTYHYYPDTGGSVLGENELSWGSDGWPIVGAVSTVPLKPCGQNGGGSAGAGGASSASGGASNVGGSDNGSAGQQVGSAGATTDGVGGQPNDAGLSESAGNSSALGGSLSEAGGTTAGTAPSGGSESNLTTGGSAGAGGGVVSAGTSSSGSSNAAGCSCALPGKSGSRNFIAIGSILGLMLAGLRRRTLRRSQPRAEETA